MNKNVVLVLVLLMQMCVSISAAAITPVEVHSVVKTAGVGSPGDIIVFVNAELWDESNTLHPKLTTWASDLGNEGYNISIYEDNAYTAIDIRDYLTSMYVEDDFGTIQLKGAIFIGELPYVKYTTTDCDETNANQTYPLDYYFMDLDGAWSGNGAETPPVFTVKPGKEDIYPEIWFGRIDASSMGNIDQQITYLGDYFDRNHTYRTTPCQCTNKGLLYVDDGLVDVANNYGTPEAFKYLFPDAAGGTETVDRNTVILGEYPDGSDFSADDYLNYMRDGDFDLVHLRTHGSSTSLSFDCPGCSKDHVYQADLTGIFLLKPYFHVFTACNISDYTVPNYLGANYIFNNTNGLVMVASSKTSGEGQFSHFYDHLNTYSFGSALEIWMKLHTKHSYSNFMCYYSGMMITGDPSLKYRYGNCSSENALALSVCADWDGDGVDDACDDCPNYSGTTEDLDEDGIGDYCDPDKDGDYVLEDGDGSGFSGDYNCSELSGYPCDDNCPDEFNPDQANVDNDDFGDLCDDCIDTDDDGYGNPEYADNTCPDDNCPENFNPGQEDLDNDGIGDECDPDIDGDGIDNALDNCPTFANPLQVDDNGNGVGDICEGLASDLYANTISITVGEGDPIAAADLNNDNYDDLMLGVDGGINIQLANGNGTFGSAVLAPIHVSVGIRKILVDDLNRDGRNDLIVLSDDNIVSVLINSGIGSFGAAIDIENTYADISIGDFNNDGFADIIGLSTVETVIVCQNNGNLTFQNINLGVTFSLGPDAILCADYNGDGYDDIVIQGRNYSEFESTIYDIGVASNNQDGTIQSYIVTNISEFRGEFTLHGDIDNDGDIDLVCLGDAPGPITEFGWHRKVYKNNGTGRFTEYSTTVMREAHDAFLLEINGDSKLDLVYTTGSSNFTTEDAIRFITNDGSGNFDTPDAIAYGNSGRLVAGRFDDDFYQDLIIKYYSSSNAELAINQMEGDSDNDGTHDAFDNCADNFNPLQTDIDNDGYGDVCDGCTDIDGDAYGNPGYAANTCVTDNCPEIANADQSDDDSDGIGDVCDDCTDIDGDGYGNPAYLANTCPDDNCPDIINPDQSDMDNDGIGDLCDPDVDGDGVPNEFDNCPTLANSDQSDIDSDGYGDICDPVECIGISPMANSNSATVMQPINAILNKSLDTETITNENIIVRGQLSGIHTGTLTYYESSFIAIGFVPDEPFYKGEIVTVTLGSGIQGATVGNLVNGYSASFTIEVDPGPGLFMPSKGISSDGNYAASATVADLDNDGDIDLASVIGSYGYELSWGKRSRVWVAKNDGIGDSYYYGNDVTINTYSGEVNTDATSVCPADIDNDGDLDLVVGDQVAGHVTIRFNDGSGAFGDNDNYDMGGTVQQVVTADINGDGHTDIITNDLKILYNNGDGTFAPFVQYPGGNVFAEVVAADINKDGLIDLILASASSTSVKVIQNLGGGEFASSVDYATDRATNHSLVVADLNNDGHLDIAIATVGNATTNTVEVLLNLGDGTFGTSTSFNVAKNPISICAADLDGDGDMDLATGNEYFSTSYSASVLLNNGDATFANFTEYEVGSSRPTTITSADLTGDGHIDIIVGTTCADDFVACNWNSYTIVSTLPNLGDTRKAPFISGGWRTTDHTPTLTWTDYWTAEEHEVEVSKGSTIYTSGPSWWDPTAEPLTAPTWTIGLSDGIWSWKVKSLIDGVWSDYSETKTFEIYTYVPPPSCPVLFTYDGENFEQENTLLTECEQYGYKLDVVDYYHVKNEVRADNGKIVFQIKEMEDEISYLNELELITVDHSANTNVAVSPDGKVVLYSESIAPLSAVDQNGIDHLEKVFSSDKNVFTARGEGYLIVDFPNNNVGQTGIYLASIPKKICDEPYDDISKLTGADNPSESERSQVTVEVMSSQGEWLPFSQLVPRDVVQNENLISDFADLKSSDKISIKISYNNGYTTDVINHLVISEEQPVVQNWAVDNLSSNAEDYVSKVWSGTSSDGTLVLTKGEMVELSFATDETLDQDSKRDYIIRAAGRYEPDYDVFSHLLPTDIELYDNYPNPFNPSTTISYNLPTSADVKLEVFNILGQQVVTLINTHQEAGHHTIEWTGNSVASGLYLYKLTVGESVFSKKMMLLK